MNLSERQIAGFQNFVLSYFTSYGRNFPWRETYDPYSILVSELMLQQTQTDRVIPKYLAFLRVFPNVEALANSTLPEVLSLWQGLGYNRRAKYLLRLAQEVTSKYHGIFPSIENELQALPGIGSYTASAIMAFAFNKPTMVIETNIRTVFIYHFFPESVDISDKQIIPIIEMTQDKNNPRIWYWALMDYGARLKKLFPNPNRKSKHYTKQSKFEGSNRQVRGLILKMLLSAPLSKSALIAQIPREVEISEHIIAGLLAEGFIIERNNKLVLAG